jgi:hypothetical protein
LSNAEKKPLNQKRVQSLEVKLLAGAKSNGLVPDERREDHGEEVKRRLLQMNRPVIPAAAAASVAAASVAAPKQAIQWLDGITALSDVMPTVVAWAGLELVNSSTLGTVLRDGKSLVDDGDEEQGVGNHQKTQEGHHFLRCYSFFNPKVGTRFILNADGLATPEKSYQGSSRLNQALVEIGRVRLAQAQLEENGGHQQGPQSSKKDPSSADDATSGSDPQRNTSSRGLFTRASSQLSRSTVSDLTAHKLNIRAHYNQLLLLKRKRKGAKQKS